MWQNEEFLSLLANGTEIWAAEHCLVPLES
jgi:hypothetical protein